MSSVSVLILTLNEEINIGQCIDSCAWCDDVVVFDSFSTDKTREIALLKGARVVERAFDDYAAQRNAALTLVTYKHPWLLMVDADERVPSELAAEIAASIDKLAPNVALLRIRRMDFFLGQWLKRSSGYPTWFGRLMRIGKVRIQRAVNEEYVADGGIGYMQCHLHHHPFNNGIGHWFDRHNRYSSMEAIAKVSMHVDPLLSSTLWSKDPIDRRRALKRLLDRMPFRPLLVFLYLYVIRLGILDGKAGFYFSCMRATYEFLIDLKVLEAKRRQRGCAP